MEHLMGAAERRDRRNDLGIAPSIPWLGFSHDTRTQSATLLEDYPIHRGWTREDLRQLEFGKLGHRSSTEVLAMLQSWMSFGLLESAFNTSFTTKDFLRTDYDGREVVQTSYMREWIDDFHSRVHGSSYQTNNGQRQQRERLIRSIQYAAFWNQRLFQMQTEESVLLTSSHLFGPVARLTTLIAEAVWAVGQRLPSPEARPFILCDWVIMDGNDRDLRERVRNRGWCPSMYDKVKDLSRTPTSVLEYISIVSPFHEVPNRHRDCSVDQCVQYNIEKSEYTMKHRTDGCQCGRVFPPLNAVKNALLNWTIPIINGIALLNEVDDNEVVLSHSPETRIRYSAISHVWSDGLGSTTEEGMLRCQVQYLVRLAMEIGKTPMLWIDSLCIPEDRAPRKLAISMMAETYRDAHRTIVLDSGIRRCNSHLSLETRMIALSLSTWQERLWTLQESSLSREVEFVFEDAVVSAETIINENGEQIHRPVNRTFHLFLDNLTYWVHNDQVTMGGLQRNLYRRTSSKPEDESLAVAPFLKIDISPLLEVDGDERMMRFWKAVRTLPKSIVVHNAPKIPHDGFRWAPRSLMNQKGSIIMDLQDQSASVVEQGLKANFWAYKLQMSTRTSLAQGAEVLLHERRANSLLRIFPAQRSTDLGLSSNQIIISYDQPASSIENFLGALLTRVSDQRGGHGHQTPIYRYEGLVGGTLTSRLYFLEIAGQSELLWQRAVSSVKGRAVGEWTDLIIC